MAKDIKFAEDARAKMQAGVVSFEPRPYLPPTTVLPANLPSVAKAVTT